MGIREPLVSVVLPFRNAERTLVRAMESIAGQDLGSFECILVDNGSGDGGPRLAAEQVRRDPRFRLLHEPRKGVVYASNRGSEEARGTYIARMDADDVALPGRLSVQAAFLDGHTGTGAVAGRVRHVGDPRTTGGFKRYVDWSNSVQKPSEIRLRRFVEAPVINPTAMWRKEVMERNGGYRVGDFPEDYEMWLRWMDRGVEIAKVPEVVLDWHDSGERLTRTDPVYSDRAFFRIKSYYLARWLARHNPFHPEVWVWGASRISRRRARILEEEGIRIGTYIDTKRSRQIEKSVLYYQDLPPAGSAFILTYIRQMNNRERIREFLHSRGYSEGKDYLLVS